MKIKITISGGAFSFNKTVAIFNVVTKISTASQVYAIINETGKLDHYFSEHRFNKFRKRMDIEFED
jgi:hypothetical protein